MQPVDRRFNAEFGKAFSGQNRLLEQRFHTWAFFSGMLFHSREKWWGDMGLRQRPHEGLDIGFFLDTTRKPIPVPKRAVVPVMFLGEVLDFGEDDFFGYTLYVKHPAMQDGARMLYTIYGHVTPHPDVYPGKTVQTGETIASVADFGIPKSGITAHLHLSVAWIVQPCSRETLSWKTINDPQKVQLIDPMPFFSDSYSVMDGITLQYIEDPALR